MDYNLGYKRITMTPTGKGKKITNRIKCFFGFHSLYKVRHIGYRSDLIGCRLCDGYWGMNHDVRVILPFDDELCDLYTSFGIRGLKKYISYKRLYFHL
jgi:hypothetical protein